ncbi:MAG TPA: H-X9-DG-CTERM domain-containing protein [Verrucomicrobiae bacterium]|nr:H-X9-DG-CTERM domain-containing protein [Verrucomicrobiae bacterium]
MEWNVLKIVVVTRDMKNISQPTDRYARTSRGLTRIDVLVAVMLGALLFTLLLAMTLPVHEAFRRRSERINCVSNLRQVGLELRETEGSGSRRPWTSLLETNAETVGLNAGQIAWINSIGISNFEGSLTSLTIRKILQCPADKETPISTNVTGIKIRISYFLNPDATAAYPQQMLCGDDNFALGKPGEPAPVDGLDGPAVKPGILLLSSSTLISWTRSRHGGIGNIGLADGSVSQVSPSALQNAAAYSVAGTPLSTNRLAIP